MVDNKITKKSRKRKGQKMIGFAQETITKSVAEKMLLSHELQQIQKKQDIPEENKGTKQKKKNKKSKAVNGEFNTEDNNNQKIITSEEKASNEVESVVNGKKSKKRKNKQEPEAEINVAENDEISTNETEDGSVKKPKKRKRKAEGAEKLETATQDELDPKKPKINKEESIRAMKRRKYAELLQKKKQAHDLEMQQKCLSYLSLWKHNRAQWKFEKLKQIWLQNNLYDDSKIPDEFFETVVDYFNSSRGKVKDVILKESLRILEKEGEETEKGKDAESGDEGEKTEAKEDKVDEKLFSNVMCKRARNIVQLLNE